jgi:hypothetical protein
VADETLISTGKIETMGNVDGGWKEFDVRKAGKPIRECKVLKLIHSITNNYFLIIAT